MPGRVGCRSQSVLMVPVLFVAITILWLILRVLRWRKGNGARPA
jgi:hypothetical protein